MAINSIKELDAQLKAYIDKRIFYGEVMADTLKSEIGKILRETKQN